VTFNDIYTPLKFILMSGGVAAMSDSSPSPAATDAFKSSDLSSLSCSLLDFQSI
jgi:hypothetical protein